MPDRADYRARGPKSGGALRRRYPVLKIETCGDRPHVGTPRERRRGAFLDAAEGLFLEQGYERVGLADVVKLSGGSLATLYELFGSKQGLLQAIAMRWRDEAMRDTFERTAGARQSNSEMLRDYAHHRAASMRSPRAIALMRMLVSEGLCDRAFAHQTYADLHLPIIRDLAALFEAWHSEGIAEIDDPLAAAEVFFSLVTGNSVLSALAGVEDDSLEDAKVDWRLELFFTHFKIR